ncbi:hypothetical protein D3C87_1569220 [compost metagenome]
MIAGEPEAVHGLGDGVEPHPVRGGEPGRGLGPVEAVPQGDEPPRTGTPQIGFEPRQRHGGVIGRQHLAAAGKARHLLEMQVGDKQGLPGPPIEGAGGQRLEIMAGEAQHSGLRDLRP